MIRALVVANGNQLLCFLCLFVANFIEANREVQGGPRARPNLRVLS